MASQKDVYERIAYLRELLNQKSENIKNGGNLVNQTTTPNFDDISERARVNTLLSGVDEYAAPDFSNSYNVTNTTNTGNTPNTTQTNASGWERTVNTITSVTDNIYTGLYNWFDSIGDFIFNTIDKIGGGVEWAQNARDYDWVSQAVALSDIYTPLYTGKWSDWANAVSGKSQTEYQERRNNELNWLANSPKANQFVTGMEQSIGYMLPSIVIGMATGGATEAAVAAGETAETINILGHTVNTVKFAQQTASLSSMAVGAFTSKANDVYEETGEYGKAVAAGTLSAGVEVATELIPWPGGNKVAGILGDTTVTFGIKEFMSEIGKQMLEEGAEEAISGFVEPFIDAIYKEGAIEEAYGSSENTLRTFFGITKQNDGSYSFDNFNESILGQFSSGALTSVAMGSPVQQYQVNKQIDEYFGNKDARKLLAKMGEFGSDLNTIDKELAKLNNGKSRYTFEELSEKYGCDIFYLNGEEFYAIARSTDEIYKDNDIVDITIGKVRGDEKVYFTNDPSFNASIDEPGSSEIQYLFVKFAAKFVNKKSNKRIKNALKFRIMIIHRLKKVSYILY